VNNFDEVCGSIKRFRRYTSKDFHLGLYEVSLVFLFEMRNLKIKLRRIGDTANAIPQKGCKIEIIGAMTKLESGFVTAKLLLKLF
jgi:hypothetical protein